MGGKKKLSLKQMEKMQMREEAKKQQKEKEKGKTVEKEKKPAGILPPDIKSEKIVEELKKIRVLTPYTVASRFNLRISAAKDLLETLESEGVVKMISGNHHIKIYSVD